MKPLTTTTARFNHSQPQQAEQQGIPPFVAQAASLPEVLPSLQYAVPQEVQPVLQQPQHVSRQVVFQYLPPSQKLEEDQPFGNQATSYSVALDSATIVRDDIFVEPEEVFIVPEANGIVEGTSVPKSGSPSPVPQVELSKILPNAGLALGTPRGGQSARSRVPPTR
jgi:hypothetical protein